MPTRPGSIPLLLTALLVLGACGGDVSTQPPASPDPTAGEDGAGSIQWAACERPDGITVEYPQSWSVNEPDILPACSAFDPEPLEVPESSELIGAAALLSVEPVEFGRAAAPEAQNGEVIDRREETIDGHRAVRVEAQSTGDALLEPGTRNTRWLIELNSDHTLTLVTHETGDAAEYEEHRSLLDRMAGRLQLPAA